MNKMAILKLIALSCIVIVAQADDSKTKLFLSKFGYLNTFAFDGGDAVSNALRSYQSFFGLPQTGTVDEATKAEMAKPRCGVADRRQHGNAFYKTSSKWSRTSLTYRFLNTGRDLPSSTVKSTIQKAFSMWSAVTPLRFTETSGRSDFTIGFYSRSHGDGSPFDGPSRVLAHAYFPSNGRLHFDEDETWGVGGGGTDLLWVAVHEIGHAIGLDHSNVRGTIMWPSYSGYNANIRLANDDISGIQSLYGSGNGGSCSDTDTSCSSWTRFCGNNDYVNRHCKKTCRFC